MKRASRFDATAFALTDELDAFADEAAEDAFEEGEAIEEALDDGTTAAADEDGRAELEEAGLDADEAATAGRKMSSCAPTRLKDHSL